jgi:hypothetical protein
MTEERRWYTAPAFVASGAFVALVVALVAWLAIGGSGRGTVGRVVNVPGVVPGQIASGSDDGCHVPAGDQTVPTATPNGVTWQLYQTVALPFSGSVGPKRIEGDLVRCYAHSPLGALVAAVQIDAHLLLARDWGSVLQTQVQAGPGRDAFSVARQRAGPGDATVTPGQMGQVAGFRFVTYTAALAVIDVVLRFANGHMQLATGTVVWVAGDWRLQLEPTGADSPPAPAVDSLAGFVIWGGV